MPRSQPPEPLRPDRAAAGSRLITQADTTDDGQALRLAPSCRQRDGDRSEIVITAVAAASPPKLKAKLP